MFWLLFAFSGPILWAASTHVDKYLVEKYFKHGSVAILMVFTAVIGLLTLPFIWFFKPSVIHLPWQTMAVMATSGILYMLAMYFYLMALQSEEASTVAPFFQTAAVFGFILGYLVLGEKPSLIQVAGGLLIIAGSTVLSLRLGKRKTKFKGRLIILMLVCSLALALSSLIFKFFAIQNEYWTTTFWDFIGQAIFGVALMATAANRKRLYKMLRANTAAVLGINGANELINLGGNLGTRFALLLAPLGVVQAISSTTLFFILLFGVLLSLFFPKLGRENVGTKHLTQKIIAIVLVVVGVVLVNQ